MAASSLSSVPMFVLYAAGSGGYASTNTSQLSSTVTSGAGGAFSITGLYTCPSASAQMYLVAAGGDSGAGANSSLALMAALGTCSNLSSSTHVIINEVTTVAAAYALAPFMATNSGSPGASLGTSVGNSQGLSQAFTTASNLANTDTGTASGASLPAGATVPSAELFTLADILATCVNSNGSTGECSTLFADATPSGGSAPQNTIDAIFDIAQNPSNNVSALYNLVNGTSPFQPTLGATPNDWTVAINYTDATLSGPASLVVDSGGNVWVVNTSGNSLTEFSNSGTVLSGSGYTGGGLSGPRFAAIDTSGNIWITNANNSLSEFLLQRQCGCLALPVLPAGGLILHKKSPSLSGPRITRRITAPTTSVSSHRLVSAEIRFSLLGRWVECSLRRRH